MTKVRPVSMLWLALLACPQNLPGAPAGDLLMETFADGFGDLVPTGDVERFLGVLTLPPDGSITTKHAIDGDLAVTIRLAEALQGALRIGFGGAGPERVVVSIGSADGGFQVGVVRELEAAGRIMGLPAPKEVVVRNRSQAIEVWLDGRVVFDHVMKIPVPGGPLSISADAAAVSLDSLQVERLGWFDGVLVDGLDGPRMAAARQQNDGRFRLLDPPPSRIDPEYRIAWVAEDGSESDPVAVRYAGIRPVEDDGIPLLTQALALSGIRPHLDIKVWDGDGPDDELPLVAAKDGAYRLDKGPGVIEAAVLTWMGDVWPTATAWDVTNDRLLDRSVPAGPARRDLFTHIPDDCDEVKITLAGPGTPTVEQVIRIKR